MATSPVVNKAVENHGQEPIPVTITPQAAAQLFKLYEWEHRGINQKLRTKFNTWVEQYVCGKVSDAAEKYADGQAYSTGMRMVSKLAQQRSITIQDAAKMLGFQLREVK